MTRVTTRADAGEVEGIPSLLMAFITSRIVFRIMSHFMFFIEWHIVTLCDLSLHGQLASPSYHS